MITNFTDVEAKYYTCEFFDKNNEMLCKAYMMGLMMEGWIPSVECTDYGKIVVGRVVGLDKLELIAQGLEKCQQASQRKPKVPEKSEMIPESLILKNIISTSC